MEECEQTVTAAEDDAEQSTRNTQREDSPDWYLMTSEEREAEEQLNAELEAKKREIAEVLTQHKLWRKKFEEKKTKVEERWKSLKERRDHRKFMEKMITG